MLREKSSSIRSNNPQKSIKDNIKTNSIRSSNTLLSVKVDRGQLRSRSPSTGLTKVTPTNTTSRKDFLKINRQNSGSREKSLRNNKNASQMAGNSSILNPQSTVKQVKGRTVKDVRLQNTKVSSNMRTSDRSKSKLKKSLNKSSGKDSLKPSTSKCKTNKSIEVSMFSEGINASAISFESKKEDISEVDCILRYIPNLVKQVCISDFQIISTLEEGNYFTDVIAFHNFTKGLFTIRIINKDKVAEHGLENQLLESIKIQCFLSRFNLPNILTLYTIFSDSCYVYLVMQPSNSSFESNLWKQANCAGIDEKSLANHTRDLLSVLQILHRNSILLRTLHLSSLRLQYDLLKITLIDQVAWLGKRQRRDSFVGKTQDVSHQLALGQSYGPSSDMWQIGLFLYSMATGTKPFTGSEAIFQIQDLDFNIPMNLSKDLGDLLTKTLTIEEHRISLEESLNHAFVKGAPRSVLSRQLWTYWNDNFS